MSVELLPVNAIQLLDLLIFQVILQLGYFHKLFILPNNLTFIILSLETYKCFSNTEPKCVIFFSHSVYLVFSLKRRDPNNRGINLTTL